MIQLGRYLNLSSEEYHAHKDSISRSALMDFKKSPRKYWAKHLNPELIVEKPKASWEFGTAFHALILEPHWFEENYFLMPEKVLLKNVGREKYDEYKNLEHESETTKKKVLSHADYKRLQDMRDSLFSNAKAKELVEQALYESSYFWRDEESGLMVKSRPDILHKNLCVDLKTIDDASPHNFQRSMALSGYHIQAAMVKDAVKNVDGIDLLACINLCVETSYPYSIGIYIIDDEAIEIGKNEYKQLLLDLKSCIIANEFNDYEPMTLGLPKWALPAL